MCRKLCLSGIKGGRASFNAFSTNNFYHHVKMDHAELHSDTTNLKIRYKIMVNRKIFIF